MFLLLVIKNKGGGKRKIKMSLEKMRVLKLSDSSRNFIPKKQRKSRNDPFVEKTEGIRNKEGNQVSGRMVGTRSQKPQKKKQQDWK